MAPISEKRTLQQYKKNTVKENVTTTTNASAAGTAADPLNRKTLEILDFRDTWITQLRNDHQVRVPPRLLGPHNHGRAVQGCQRCDAPIDKRNDEMEVAKKTSGKQNKKHHHHQHSHNPQQQQQKPQQQTQQQQQHQQQQQQQQQQLLQRSGSVRSKSKGREVNKIWIGDSQTFEYILKSARGEIKPKKSGNLKVSNKIGGKRNNKICECGSSNDDENNYNIIVNPFYAEQLLHGDKTDKTFNSLKKHFPPTDYPDPNLPYRSKNNNNTADDKQGKRDKSAENLSSPAGSEDGEPQPEDSEEEYFGYPFYLSHDASTGHQSKYIKKDGFHYTPKSIISPSIFPKVAPYLAFSSYFEKGPTAPALLRRILKWRLSPATPRVVKKIVLNSGFRLIKNTSDWMAVWDRHIKSPSFKTIRLHQKYNHLPGSFRLGRKDTIWRSLRSNIAKFGKHEFGIMQTTYIMPEDRKNFRRMWQNYSKKSTKWIVKPPASARGCGISVVHKWQQIPKDEPVIVQKYIQRPLLINENKFDLRLYVLVTSVNPLRIFMYKDGLARFASVKYNADSKTLNEKCMHLTNYSINKFSQNYAKNEDVNACQGHKWSLQSLFSFLEERDVNTILLWAGLRNLVIKSIISGESALNRLYRQNVNSRYNCFELLGFDVLLDEDVIPWLLEVNVSPSLHSELPLDWHVKGPLIQAVLNTALYQIPPKLSEKHQEELLDDLDLEGPLCFDHRLFTTCLTAEEIRKHNQFTKPSMELREEYLEAILEDLKPDDVRCLVILEDELQRSKPLERIFPTSKSHIYLKYVENPRYYNRLVDAWETKYADNRSEGIALLTGFCKRGVHLNVSIDASLKEPDVALTDIDLMYKKKIPMDDDNLSIDQSDFDPPAGVTAALKQAYLPIPSPSNVVRGCTHAIGAVYSKENNDHRSRVSKVSQNHNRRRPVSVTIN